MGDITQFWREVESIHFVQFVTLRLSTIEWIRSMELNVLPTLQGD
jgi:hypothetical protein